MRCLQQLNRVEEMFRQKYGISGEGESRWTLGIKVNRDREAHIVSLSQELYIDNLVERFGHHSATTVTTPLAPGTILPKDQCTTTHREQRRCPAATIGNSSAPYNMCHSLNSSPIPDEMQIRNIYSEKKLYNHFS